MKVIRCPECKESLPEMANYCAHCGTSLTSPKVQPAQSSESPQARAAQESPLSISTTPAPTGSSADVTGDDSSLDGMKPWGLGRLEQIHRSMAPKVPHFYAMSSDTHPAIEAMDVDDESTQPLHPRRDTPAFPLAEDEDADTQPLDKSQKLVKVAPGQWRTFSANGHGSKAKGRGVSYEDHEADDSLQDHSHATWNKVVPPRTPPGGVAVADRPATSAPPDPSDRVGVDSRHNISDGEVPLAGVLPQRRISPRLFFWFGALAILLFLFIGGILGVVSPWKHTSRTRALGPLPPMLSISPENIAFGGTITLRGSHFTPNAQVGLYRDASIQIVDTSGATFIRANSQGSFTDTVTLDDPNWLSGQHTILAEDAHAHKIARFLITVLGHSTSLLPAHLQISTTSIDLGPGDQATNSTHTIELSNAGGGQISWQSTVTQSWLLLSPKSGTLAPGQSMQVMIGGDRSVLSPGYFAADVNFSSSAGNVSLLVNMQVTPLQSKHQAVLQLTPAMLSFSATDGNSNPGGQNVTISDPGTQTLQWNSSITTTDGSNWLSISPQTGTVTSGSQQAVTVNVNTSNLLPGVYTGMVTFANVDNTVMVDNSQSVFVSLTIVPQCGLQVSPGSLTFTDVYGQPAPSAKVITAGVTQGCSRSLSWGTSVTTNTGGSWLSIGPASGSTPASPSVSVNVAGLGIGTYTGSIVFSSSTGTQTVPVTFIMGQQNSPVTQVAPTAMTFSGIIGQSGPIPPQTVSVVNTGGGTLNWTVTPSTTVGGAWLGVSQSSGTLSGNGSIPVNVSVTLLAGLTPGTYNGTVTIDGTDGSGNPAAGAPQIIPVTFTVQAPCTVSVAPGALSFTGVATQANPQNQNATLTASGTCNNALNWSATADANWLKPAQTGTVSLTTAATPSIGVTLANLTPNTYTGNVTIKAFDSVSNAQVGTPQVIKVTLTVLQPCTLGSPSVPGRNFSVEQGLNPGTKGFMIGVTGTCNGNVTITPTAIMDSGSGWLNASSAATVASGGTTRFIISVTSAALSPGVYTGSISLTGIDGSGAIAGDPQAVTVRLRVIAPPSLTVDSTALTFNVMTGTGVQSQSVKIGNAGGEPLDWSAALDANTPSFITLSATSGTGLTRGNSVPVSVNVDTTNLAPGPYTTNVTVSATDPITGNAVSGSPVSVSITVNVSPPPSAMQLSTTSLTFKTTAGTNPAMQTITLTNSGGGTLTWTVGTPSATWLMVSPTSGSDDAGISTPLTFSVDVTGLAHGKYSAAVDITGSDGSVVTVKITLRIK